MICPPLSLTRNDMSYFITNSVTKRRLSYKKLSHPSDSPLPPRGHRPPPSGRADAGGARSAQRGRSQRGRAAALRTCRRRHRRRCRWIGSSCPPHGKGRCPPIGSLRSPLPPQAGEAAMPLSKAFPVITGSGQRQPITHRCRSCSWDVFPYDLLPNQLRPVDLLLGQVSKGDRESGGRGTKQGL